MKKNIKLFLLSVDDHPGRVWAIILPLAFFATTLKREPFSRSALALATVASAMVWSMVLVSAWTNRKDYKDEL